MIDFAILNTILMGITCSSLIISAIVMNKKINYINNRLGKVELNMDTAVTHLDSENQKYDVQLSQIEKTISYLENKLNSFSNGNQIKASKWRNLTPRKSLSKVILDYLIERDTWCTYKEIMDFIKLKDGYNYKSVYPTMHTLYYQAKTIIKKTEEGEIYWRADTMKDKPQGNEI